MSAIFLSKVVPFTRHLPKQQELLGVTKRDSKDTPSFDLCVERRGCQYLSPA